MAEKQTTQEQQQTPQAQPEVQESEGRTERERGIARREVPRTLAPRVAGTIRSPFSMMRRMMDDMDRLFEDFGFGAIRSGLSPFFREPLLPSFGEIVPTTGVFVPDIEVLERDGKLVVRADLPGIKKEDIHVTCDEHGLVIEGERKSSREEKGEGYYHSERSYGSFSRRIPIPEGADVQSCDATFDDGVLEVCIDLPKESRRKIEVRSRSEAAEGTESGAKAEEHVRH